MVAAIGSGELVGTRVPAEGGTAGYVLASGQPVAMMPRADDPAATEGVVGVLGIRPASVLCVPCAYDDEVLGVLELVDKAGGGAFTFDDVELATVLANIAGSALRDRGPAVAVRPADELAADLRQLSAADPASLRAGGHRARGAAGPWLSSRRRRPVPGRRRTHEADEADATRRRAAARAASAGTAPARRDPIPRRPGPSGPASRRCCGSTAA